MIKFTFIPIFIGTLTSLVFTNTRNFKTEEVNVVSSYVERIEKYRQKAIECMIQVNLDDYREAQANLISSTREATINKINNSYNYYEMDSIVSSYNRYILSIPTDADLTKEEEEEASEDTGIYYISSFEDLVDFQQDVNSGYSYINETVVLTNDIVIPNGVVFDPIGKTDTLPFSGTFDGAGYTISGMTKSGDDSIALFSRVTNGVVKNLNIANFNITVTKNQRAAGVVSRAKDSLIDNVHVLSGTITGKTQTGGVVGFALGNTTIQNCSNAATVIGAGEHTGGILGSIHTDAFTRIIRNCINTGSVSSTANSTGGIIGGSQPSSSGVLQIIDCTNEGSISGLNYVGGIIGIARQSAQAQSNIINCVNKANVAASSSTGVGGISGFSRIAVTDCSCLYSVTIKNKLASTLPDVGCVVEGTGGCLSNKFGFITGGMGMSAVQSGGKLIDSEGHEYIPS